MKMRVTYWLLIAIVALTTPSYGQLSARLEAVVTNSIWSYTLFNDEPVGSPNHVSSFTIAVGAPITQIVSPSGWGFDTDNNTYVFWFNADAEPPFPNDVAPGLSLAGFEFVSENGSPQLFDYNVQSWDHVNDQFGPNGSGTVIAPSLSAPEPSSGILIVATVIYIVICGRKYLIIPSSG